jgi:hypothetical protein
MQIIIGQAEIERAIIAHVLAKVAINPDQHIEVELKATRGEVGYQAFISIGEKVGTLSAPAHKPQASVAQKVPSNPAEVRAMMEAEAAAEEVAIPDNEGQPTTEVPAEEVYEAPAETAQPEVVEAETPAPAPKAAAPRLKPAVPAQTAPAEPVAAQVGGSDAPPPRKLFGGFTKPKNN